MPTGGKEEKYIPPFGNLINQGTSADEINNLIEKMTTKKSRYTQ